MFECHNLCFTEYEFIMRCIIDRHFAHNVRYSESDYAASNCYAKS